MPLGQCLQPGHTLAPVAIQGGHCPSGLQAPDVHQATLRPVGDRQVRDGAVVSRHLELLQTNTTHSQWKVIHQLEET